MDPGSTPTQPVDDANPSPLTIVDPNPVPVDVPAGPPQPPAKDDNVATTEPTDSEEATATPDAATISDPDQTASPVVPGAFSSGPPESQAPTTLSSNAPASSSSSSPLTRSPSSPDPAATANASLLSVSPEQGQVSPAEGAPQERRPIYKKKRSHPPKGILKPAPPPQKGFSFRRDILQNINTRLAQQGVNVQVPVPPSGTAQATASYIGGMFRKIGGMAAGAAANVGGTGNGPVANFLTGARDPLNGPTSPLVLSLNPADPRTQGVQRQGSTASFASDTTASSVMTAKTTSSTVSKATISAAPLKKVQFQVSHMKVTYPIVGSGTPEDEDLTRMRIEREHRKMLRARKSKKWTPEELEALYRDCCRTREEHPLKKMRLVFQEAAQASPPGLRTMDLSFVPLDRHAVEPIADLLSVDFGLTKLVLENCALTDDSVKSILHALLVSGTLPNLSLASNRKIRFNGWRYIAIFMRRARALRYLDLSENSINKASLEHLLMAIAKSPESVTHPAGEKDKRPSSGVLAGKAAAANDDAMNHEDQDFDEEGEPLMPTAPLLRNVSEEDEPPASAITSLRLENCGLKSSSLEMLSQAVRYSEIRHLSLRRNGINQVGSVSVSMMLKDYPDSIMSDQDTLDQNGSSAYPDARLTSGATSTNNGSWQSAGAPGRAGRTRELNTSSANRQRSYSPSLPEVPVIVSSPGGGITSRRMPGSSGPGSQSNYGSVGRSHGGAETLSIRSPTREIEAGITEADLVAIRRDAQPNQTDEEAIAIYQAKRAKRILADLPRVGNLLTLDLKSNDIRGGVNYIAQVLKKNRTLRVLNLSDNNIEMSGLVAIADALKYNSTLETLDLSHNPCSGPGLEGITTLRTAFTLNSNLKRLFLNDTDLSSEGAIALAEFLPEAKSLIHLDLAENFDIDIAGVMALAVSVRMNKSLRCLDLNIPPNNPDFARLSQEILTSCIRNTELAQQRATQKGLKQPIAAPIYKSVVARAARERDERLKAIQAARAAEEQAALAAAGDKKKAAEELLVAAAECRNVLRDLLAGEEKNQREAPEQKISPPGDFVEDLTRQSKSLGQRLADLATTSEEGSILEQSLTLHDELTDVTTRLERFYRYGAAPFGDPKAHQPSALGALGNSDPSLLTTPVIDPNLSSPTFSIADSDDSDSGTDDEASPSQKIGEGSAKGKHKASSPRGLRITTNLAPAADREEPEELEPSSKSPKSPSEDRARGQLSEEGELFRKAKSLGLDSEAVEADDDEEDGRGGAADAAQTLENGGENGSNDGVKDGPKARRGSSSSIGSNKSGSLNGSNDSGKLMLEENAEISGEELRKDLLETKLPPKVPRSKEELDAAARQDSEPIAQGVLDDN